MLVEDLSILKKNFFFTIIGSGPASLSLALDLEEKGFEVLILEAGAANPTEFSQDFYKGKVIGNEYFNLDSTRLRCLGGSSQHWGGWSRPLDEHDFYDWPINKKDLDPFLNKACKILNIKDNFVDRSITPYFNQINFEFSNVRFKEKYFDYIKNSKKIFLSLNTPVLKILGDINSAKSLNIFYQNKLFLNLKVKNLILGCGGLENSRILLWSQASSDSDFLKNFNIGNFWMEHPHHEVGAFVGDYLSVKKMFNLNMAKNNEIFFSPSLSLIKKHNIKNCSLRFQYQFDRESIYNLLNDLKCNGNNYVKRMLKSFRTDRLCSFRVRSVWEQPGYLLNCIKLSKNLKDFFGVPQIELYWKKRRIEKKSPLILLNELGKYFANLDKGRIGILNYLNEDNDVFSKTSEPGGHHHMGGTRIGYNFEKNDLVDINLRVFGIKNLYIVGSSVFRTGGHANPTLTIVQLSLRLAEHLNKNFKI